MTYRDETKLLREERDSYSYRERELTRNLLQLWKDIRDVRARKGYTNTGHKLIIRKVRRVKGHKYMYMPLANLEHVPGVCQCHIR